MQTNTVDSLSSLSLKHPCVSGGKPQPKLLTEFTRTGEFCYLFPVWAIEVGDGNGFKSSEASYMDIVHDFVS